MAVAVEDGFDYCSTVGRHLAEPEIELEVRAACNHMWPEMALPQVGRSLGSLPWPRASHTPPPCWGPAPVPAPLEHRAAPYGSEPALDTPNSAPPVHRTPSQCLGRSSEPPPKPPTPLRLTIQAGDAIILDGSHCEGLGGMGGGHLVYRFESCSQTADGVLWSDPLHAAAGALSPPPCHRPPPNHTHRHHTRARAQRTRNAT